MVSFCLFAVAARGQAPPAAQAPTVQDARAFVDRVNATLLGSNVERSRTAWVAATYISDDTEALTAINSSRWIAQVNQFIAESRRFDGLTLPADVSRQIMLLRTNAIPAPSDPALRLETTQLRAQLQGLYGKGKYCVRSGPQECLGIDELDVRMAKSRDPQELLELWTGWHAIAVPMRAKYTRFVELSNQGARELGVADTGALWRSRYDMQDTEFSLELERTWRQLHPLYEELHAYVRARLIQKYGAVANRAAWGNGTRVIGARAPRPRPRSRCWSATPAGTSRWTLWSPGPCPHRARR